MGGLKTNAQNRGLILGPKPFFAGSKSMLWLAPCAKVVYTGEKLSFIPEIKLVFALGEVSPQLSDSYPKQPSSAFYLDAGVGLDHFTIALLGGLGKIALGLDGQYDMKSQKSYAGLQIKLFNMVDFYLLTNGYRGSYGVSMVIPIAFGFIK